MASHLLREAKGISLWLSPRLNSPSRTALRSIIRSNATGNVDFEPHITLLSLPRASPDHLEEIIGSLKKITHSIQPFSVSLKALKTGSTFFQSVLLEVEKSAQLQGLYKATEEHFGKYANPDRPAYYPHLSLFYGAQNTAVFSKIKDSVSRCKLEDSNLTIDRIEVYSIDGEVGSWFQLGSFPLHESVFFRSTLFSNNEWVPPAQRSYLDVINPATREVIHKFPAATAEDVNRAVHAAKAAFQTWSETTGQYRAQFLNAFADKIKEKREDLAKTEVLDNGKPIEEAYNDVDDTEKCFRYYAQQAIELDAKQNTEIKLPDSSYTSRIRYDPTGVSGLIIPWNYPLLMAAWKIAPCLAAGCTAVLKPSELTPLNGLELGSIAKSIGLPPGVLNIVTGMGDAGQVLSSHPDVEKVAFTGSVPTATRVLSASAPGIKNVTLELGGKSPFIVFDDSNVDQAAEWIMMGVFFNSGQVCSSTSRVLLQENIHDKVLDRLVKAIEQIRIGDGLDPETKLGPIVSEGQYNKVLAYISKGLSEGATLLTGGLPSAPELQKGYFVPPTVFANVTPNMTIWKEEIFGPVLSVAKFKTEEEAVASANDTPFGLAGAVMSKDKQRCDRVARKLRAGIIWINCSQPTFVESPWGGMKKSGVGRELGPWGLDNYLEVKQITTYEEDDGLGYEWYIKDPSNS